MKWVLVAASALGIAVAASVAWRLSSRRRSLPCPIWLRWLVELDNPFTRTQRAAEIVRRIDLQPGMSVADIGCGPGRLTLPAARMVGPEGFVLALDVQPGMLKRLADKLESEGVSNVTLQAGAIETAELGRDRFDRALMVTVLGEIPNREAALTRVYESLRPGGTLTVTELIFDPHFQTQAKVRALARDAGFCEPRVFGSWFAYSMTLLKPPA